MEVSLFEGNHPRIRHVLGHVNSGLVSISILKKKAKKSIEISVWASIFQFNKILSQIHSNCFTLTVYISEFYYCNLM